MYTVYSVFTLPRQPRSRDIRSAAVFIAALAIVLLLPAPALAQKLPPSSNQIAAQRLMDASLAAGKLRASSQRVARLYLESGSEMRPHRTQIALAAELANVESSLVTLKKATLKDDYRRRNLELGKIMWGLFDDIITRAATRSDVSQILDISKCADGMWSITQSSRTAYVVAFKARSGTDKLIARNSSKTL